jgi:voltage-gated potassium channel
MRRKFIILASIFCGLVLAGMAIFHFVEGRDTLDSFYATVVTLTTIGYGDITPHSNLGKALIAFFILCGVATVAYIVSNVTAHIIEGTLQDILKRKKMERDIEKLEKHVIICGCGIVGRYVMEELLKTKTQFVLVAKEIDESIAGEALFIKEDPSNDQALIKAGIMKARGLVAVMPDDRDNLFVVLTARSLNNDLRIIAKCSHEDTIKKIRKAGADSVVMPEYIGGLRMASEMLRPEVVSFLDVMMRDPRSTVRVDEIALQPKSSLCGRQIKDLHIPKASRALLVALKRGREHIFNPDPKTELAEGDTLVFIGEVDDIAKLRNHVNRS